MSLPKWYENTPKRQREQQFIETSHFCIIFALYEKCLQSQNTKTYQNEWFAKELICTSFKGKGYSFWKTSVWLRLIRSVDNLMFNFHEWLKFKFCLIDLGNTTYFILKTTIISWELPSKSVIYYPTFLFLGKEILWKEDLMSLFQLTFSI